MAVIRVRVLGIDPGSQRTGFGVLDAIGPRLSYVASGVIRTASGDFASRLCEIFRCVQTIVSDYQPQEIAIERVFMNRNADSALKLGQARGVAMLAPAMFGISVAEYAPNQVKKTVVGAGHADKNQILMMLKILLPKAEPKSPDAADALAVAITHAHHRQSAALRLRVVEV